MVEVLESFTSRGCESVCETVIMMRECKAGRIRSKNIYLDNLLQVSTHFHTCKGCAEVWSAGRPLQLPTVVSSTVVSGYFNYFSTKALS